MWNRTHRRHCTDHLLIAHADGELRAGEESAVAAHLLECWECRGRMAELNQTAQSLARLAAQHPYGGAARAAAAKASFLDWRRRFERESVGRRRICWNRAALWAAAAAAAFLVFMGVSLWRKPDRGRPGPLETLALAQQREQALFRTPSLVHQVIEVQVLQTAPEQRRGGGRLEVWDDGGERYASRWTDLRGELQCALWRPSASQAWQFDARLGRTATQAVVRRPRNVVLMELEAGRFEEFESAVLEWVRNRTWRPVEVVGDFARFTAAGGLTLEAQRIRTAGNRPGLRLKAHRRAPQADMEFTVELDAETHRPRLQEATYRIADRVFLVRLIVAREELVPPAKLDPAVFSPEPALLASVPKLTLPLPPRLPRPESPLDELEVMHALHQAGGCTPQAVEEPRVTDPAAPGQRLAELTSSGCREAAELCRLARWATPERTGRLEARGWRLLSRMVEDHEARLRERISQSRELLRRLVPEPGHIEMITPPHGSEPEGESWATDAAHVLSHLERAERSVRDLSALPEPSDAGWSRAAGFIAHDLSTAEQELDWFRQEWTQLVRRGVELAAGRADQTPQRIR